MRRAAAAAQPSPVSFSAGNHHGFTAQFKALPALSAKIMAVAVASVPFRGHQRSAAMARARGHRRTGT